ncbi:hypothetical protein [Aliamphritea hakodatensis]|uniref:hypothetical protein n=1 Tax=Aliamphritea hakodatensis TaxID=2895352 RepID=UPI0022FD3C8E|nr:hypothetical protein [Aliamphritea hakodatensis]
MSSFHINTKALTRTVATFSLLFAGWHSSVVAQPAAMDAEAVLSDLAGLNLTAVYQLSDEHLAGMRGQGSEALVVAAQRHEVILWDEDSSDKGRGNRSVHQGNQVITIKVNLGGR